MKQCGPTGAELKPDVKGTFHPSGPKCLNVNVWLWKHYSSLLALINCEKWALCHKGGETIWIPRSDESVTANFYPTKN